MNNYVRVLTKSTKILICTLSILILLSWGVLTALQIKPAVVVSGSMEPVIHTGSLVLIDTEYDNIKTRDIIAFDSGDMLTTHRVCGISSEGYVTKGDANDSTDPGIVSRSSVEGRVVLWVPVLGYVLKTITSRPLIIGLATLAALTLLIRKARKGEADGRCKKKDTEADSYSRPYA